MCYIMKGTYNVPFFYHINNICPSNRTIMIRRRCRSCKRRQVSTITLGTIIEWLNTEVPVVVTIVTI